MLVIVGRSRNGGRGQSKRREEWVSALFGNCLLIHGINLCRGNPIRFACAYTEPKTAPLVFAILEASNALAVCIFKCPNLRNRRRTCEHSCARSAHLRRMARCRSAQQRLTREAQWRSRLRDFGLRAALARRLGRSAGVLVPRRAVGRRRCGGRVLGCRRR